MGYASYQENVSERNLESIRDARTALNEIKTKLHSETDIQDRKNPTDHRKRLSELQKICGQLEKSLSNLLEMATHPWISVAYRYFEDLNRLNKLEDDTRQFLDVRRKEKEALERAIASKSDVEIELRTRIILLEDENRKLKRQNKTIKDEVLYRQNPGSLFGSGVKPIKKK